MAATALGLGWASWAQTKKMELESYQLVLLRRPANAPNLPAAELERLQGLHLAHLRKMAESGKLLVAGPFDDQPDPSLRGMCLYKVGSLDEARLLAEQDPSVKAGRLKVEVMTWWTEKGALAFPLAASLKQQSGERLESRTAPDAG